MKKITVQPTIHDLEPKQSPTIEPRRESTWRVPIPLLIKLKKSAEDTGYSQNELVTKALEAFLK